MNSSLPKLVSIEGTSVEKNKVANTDSLSMEKQENRQVLSSHAFTNKTNQLFKEHCIDEVFEMIFQPNDNNWMINVIDCFCCFVWKSIVRLLEKWVMSEEILSLCCAYLRLLYVYNRICIIYCCSSVFFVFKFNSSFILCKIYSYKSIYFIA